MKIKFLGQNCFLFNYEGKTIISDPFYNAQKEKSGFDVAAQQIDYILVTHAHGDHTADIEEVLKHHPKATVIGQPEICGHYDAENKVDVNIGGTVEISNLKLTMVQAAHTSSFPDGSYGGVPSGYIMKFADQTIYFAGDTAVMADMELFPKLFGEISLSVLPIGGHYTMDAKQASFAAAELLKTRKVIGCHFDTFEAIEIDHEASVNIFKDRKVELILPKLGEEFSV